MNFIDNTRGGLKKNRISIIAFVLVIAVGVLGFGENVRAGVDLPWETTYDCDCDGNSANGDTDWLQYSDTLICDGLGKHGGWTCDQGGTYYEQITSAANYVNGGGGKGQRHWEGDGQNKGSGGIKIEFNSMQPELWIRWYMRYELGFTWAGGVPGYDKILYITGAKSLVPELSYDEVIVGYAGPGDVTSSGNKGWTYINGGSTGDGEWHCHEVHLKDGSSTGVAEWWIDGARVINRTGIDMGSGGWDAIAIGSNQNQPQNGRCMAVDFDDFKVVGPGDPSLRDDGNGSLFIGPLNEANATAPIRFSGQPNGTLSAGTTSTNISLTTDKQAICRYSNVSNTNYTDMEYNFTYANSTNHSTLVTGLENGLTYTFYIRCNSSDGYVNDDDWNISFSVDRHKADLNDDGVINMPELMAYIAKWKANDGVTKQEVEEGRGIWFAGGNYPQ